MKHLRLGAAVVLAVVAAGAVVSALPRERTIATYATTLAGRTGAQRHNARLALEKINGARIAPGEVFSFNDRVGTFSRDRGYRRAPVSYNGQLIDDWGGGVCQASTTLYNAALLSGMAIVERHRHQFQPSYVPPGRDAAVAFSNIDLRFQNPYDFPVTVEAKIVSGIIRVSIVASRDLPTKPQVYSRVIESAAPSTFRTGEGNRSRMRNSGKRGWEVAVYRTTGDKTVMVSKDTYPVMHRVIENK
ncbi:MAG TPA: VanW family protein [Fimbriimonas sp.]|nr:VanW family protein [Fimbriimonas sp.]